MTHYKLFLITTGCDGAYMPMLPVFDIQWGRLR